METYEEYERVESELAESKLLFEDSADDAEMREMARAEMKTLTSESAALERALQLLMLPSDPNDDREESQRRLKRRGLVEF